MIATIGEAGIGSVMARAIANPDVSKEVVLIGGHAGKTVLHHKPDGSLVLLNPTVPIPPQTEPIIFKPSPVLKPDPASIKSGKQLRRERRKKERKNKK
jgi:hypothetical protein